MLIRAQAGWHSQCVLMSLEPFGGTMKTAGLIAVFFSLTTATAGPPKRAPSPKAEPPVATMAAASLSQLPLLFIVDGVRCPGNQVPLLSADLVASVKVIKGHRALEQYGPDASYGVVVITTKLASATRRS
jgi:hypothetical protein